MEIELTGNDPRVWAISLGFTLVSILLIVVLSRFASVSAARWRVIGIGCLVAGLLIAMPGVVRNTIERTFSEPGVHACAHFLRAERYLPSLVGSLLVVALVARRPSGRVA